VFKEQGVFERMAGCRSKGRWFRKLSDNT